ncbi:hypothetical protein KEM55_002994 [Ascosphaera atra]|nr:hypothetical protein KEM55_002994 [Ascosphaera atra]
MDAYPQSYVDHNVPLVCISGLGSTNDSHHGATPTLLNAYPQLRQYGLRIESDYPTVTGAVAERVLQSILQRDDTHRPWNALYEEENGELLRLHLKKTGRSFILPPLHALSSQDDSGSSEQTSLAPTPHSPISPLTPSSPTFPDGIMTWQWTAKHQDLVPAAVVNFFPFTTDQTQASLRDNQLKIEINALKKEWASSGYKTRFFVGLISDEGIPHEDTLDRLAIIRRATGLDTKSLFFLPPNPAGQQIEEYVTTLLLNLHGPVGDYYRDLSKHARRKRNRSSVPPPTAPPTGTSQTLSAQGWNIRYEFKLGVFFEFRQEMEAACRCYESAYDNLFDAEVFETIAGWSSRFDDARMLADVLALRIVRCLLWLGQTSAATRAWSAHRSVISNIVATRGKGTKNYGFEAWEARWSVIMAELLERAEIFKMHHSRALIYAPSERAHSISERSRPWDLLHHEGYWLLRAAQHTKRRRRLAEDIPTEDRQPPGSNPEAKRHTIARTMYDTYLVPEPYDEYPLNDSPSLNHSAIIVDLLRRACDEFAQRDQEHMVENLKLEVATEYMGLGKWQDALDTLRPLWPTLSWRKDGWWRLMERFAMVLRQCAVKSGDLETVLKVDWEMSNKVFSAMKGHPSSIHASLEGIEVTMPKPAVVLRSEDSISCLSASLVFAHAEGHVGEPLQLQLKIESRARSDSSPISLSEVKIVFEGSLRPIRLMQDPESSANDASGSSCQILPITLQEPANDDLALLSPSRGLMTLFGTTNLTFAPGQTRAFNLQAVPREAGEVLAASISLIVDEPSFNIDFVVTNQQREGTVWWSEGRQGPYPRRIGKDRNPTIARVLPKPPKVDIKTPNLRETYYTDEHVQLQVDVRNAEEEAVDLVLEVRLLGSSESSVKFHWADDPDSEPLVDTGPDPSSPETPVTLIRRRTMGLMESGATDSLSLVVTHSFDAADYEAEITAFYHLKSDPETPVFTSIPFTLTFVRPFEANFELLPRLHPDPWPDFFNWEDSDSEEPEKPRNLGLRQRWCLSVKMVSFALDPLVVEEVTVTQLGPASGCTCDIEREHIIQGPYKNEISPEELRVSEFNLELQRLALDDRRTTSLDLALDIKWHRRDAPSDSASYLTTTALPMPRFIVPLSEPRVLCAATQSQKVPSHVYLDYTLENPSMHYLTFHLTMEASDHFAFSGPKSLALQLVPQSRETVRYSVLANTQGAGRWIQPNLVVIDPYFKKTLNVLPTEGMRVDKNGLLVWVEGSS